MMNIMLCTNQTRDDRLQLPNNVPDILQGMMDFLVFY